MKFRLNGKNYDTQESLGMQNTITIIPKPYLADFSNYGNNKNIVPCVSALTTSTDNDSTTAIKTYLSGVKTIFYAIKPCIAFRYNGKTYYKATTRQQAYMNGIHYNGNGSTSGSTASQMGWRWRNPEGMNTNLAKFTTDTFKVASNGFTKDGFSFTGWNTKTDGSGTAWQPGAIFDGSSYISLYAQWKQNYHIPGGSYSVANFKKLINNYIAKGASAYAANDFSVIVNNNTFSVKAGRVITHSEQSSFGYIEYISFSGGTGIVGFRTFPGTGFAKYGNYCIDSSGSSVLTLKSFKDYPITISPGINFS